MLRLMIMLLSLSLLSVGISAAEPVLIDGIPIEQFMRNNGGGVISQIITWYPSGAGVPIKGGSVLLPGEGTYKPLENGLNINFPKGQVQGFKAGWIPASGGARMGASSGGNYFESSPFGLDLIGMHL